MGKVIGYLEGTDALWLTTLQMLGYDTEPVSNGSDSHGMNIQMIDERRQPSLVLGYIHKIMPTPDMETSPGEILNRTTIYQIPVLVVCPTEHHERARQLVPELPSNAQLVDPGDVINKIRQILH